MEATGERFIPGEASWLTTADHISRYQACAPLCSNKIVLDVACGSGYGSAILACSAAEVHGVDIDGEAVEWAATNYASPSLTFQTGSVAMLPFEDAYFDVVISFETLEHVPSELQEQFIDEARRVLKPAGIFVISTPDRLLTEERETDNPFHVRELNEAEFTVMLSKRFSNVNMFHQNMWAYNEILPSDPSQPTALALDNLRRPRGQNLIAVCGETPALPSIAAVRRTDTGLWDLHAGMDERLREVYRSVHETAERYERSFSWRITAPLRAIRRLFG